jgi:tetratricopeptide (TPR) repeat protein
MTSAIDRPLSPAQSVERASTLLASDPRTAQRHAEAILRVTPKDPRAQLVLASALRRQGKAAAARALLDPLAKAFPRALLTQYELGLVLADLGETAASIAALRHVVSLNRDFADAWRALGEGLFSLGDARGAQAAFAEHERASVTDPALREAADALFQNRLADAERLLRAHLAARPTDAAALRLLADTVAAQGRDSDAERLLELCLQIDAAYDGARFTYAEVLFRRQKGAQALAQVERLLAARPDDPAHRNLHAACLALVGDYGRAMEVYEGLLAQFPAHPNIWLNYGHALRTTGRQDDTVAAYRRGIALSPALGEAYWSLANLKTVLFSTEERSAMAAQLARPDISDEDRLHLHYALGKALEDVGDWEASFGHYAHGAALRRAQFPHDAEETSARTRRSRALFTPAFFAARADGGSPSSAPIFVVGLPRSGSTLIEQILASHSAVEGTQELPDIPTTSADLGLAYPEVLADLDPRALAVLGRAYLDAAAVHRRRGRPFFIDKMPNNFQHIGLIRLILPNAKIIDARRHPMAACFSAYKQHFAQGQAFSYDLTDLGRYYRDYADLMAHYDAVLPGRAHRVIYEDLVEDLETQVRSLLDHCGLPFEPACLNFHKTDRAIRTVSSEQVRRPIYRAALDHWRHFEPWLEPLKAALGPALNDWRR